MSDNNAEEAIPVVQYKHGEQLLETCAKCAGCGLIANDDDESPWKYWAELPNQLLAAVRAGIVKPLTCPKCLGLGKVVISK